MIVFLFINYYDFLFLPAAAIFAILAFPYFFLPMDAAKAAGLVTPFFPANFFFNFLNLPPPPNFIDVLVFMSFFVLTLFSLHSTFYFLLPFSFHLPDTTAGSSGQLTSYTGHDQHPGP